MTVRGSCLCESVKYEIEGEPIRFNCCHCSNCAKVTGAEAGHFVFFKEEQVKYTANPPDVLRTYEDTAVVSGNTMFRRFCSTCGSTLFVTPSARKGIIIVPYGGIDEPPEEWRPTNEVWCRKKSGWAGNVVPEEARQD